MKKHLLHQFLLVLLCLLFSNFSNGQGIPEILYYKFNNTGTSVPNLASSPPSGTSNGIVNGGLTIGGTVACGSSALIGSGGTSNTDYLDTKWATSTSGSWTISFVTDSILSTTTLYYLFSDITSSSLRCFTGGVAGAGNWIIRGGFNDVLITGGASTTPAVNTIVYDAASSNFYAYLNGKLVNTVAQTSFTQSSTGTLILSGYNSLNGLTPRGKLDEFRFYSHALTAKEVARLMYTGSSKGNVNLVACGTSFKSPSGKFTWTKNGTYYDTIPNAVSCDSFMTINLSFKSHSYATINPIACDFFVGPSKTAFWTKSGIYTDKIPNKAGCDSIITINLTIKNSTSTLLKLSKCDSYKSPSGKYIWTTSGKYYDTIPNKKGCDSLITITLTMGKTSTNSFSVKACDKYKSPSGKRTWTTAGTYRDTIVNTSGCDSILTINLTLNKSTAKAITVKACNKYKSPSGKYTWLNSGTFMDTITNKKGCDSLITINLTVNKSTYVQISPITCGTYTSPSGKYTVNYTTSFFDTIPNARGCDSIILIDVKVYPKTSATISRTVCKRFISPSKKYIWTISGKYYDTIPNRKGCDSLITVNLTINNVTVAVSQKGPRLTALADGVNYQWLNCTTNYQKISGEINKEYIATAIGKYAVEVTEGSCVDTSICLDVTNLPVDKFNSNNSLSVFPNPANGQFTISSGKPLNNASIKVVNALGELIIQKCNVFGSSVFIDISGHSNGIYFIEISEKENSGRVKLIKY